MKKYERREPVQIMKNYEKGPQIIDFRVPKN